MTRILTLVLLLMPLCAWSAPTSVTLFPSSAQVEETSAVTPTTDGDGFVSALLTLPGQADPATLRLGKLPAGASVTDLSWTLRSEQNLAALEPLNARLAALKTERDAIRAEQEGIRGRVAFWKAQTQPAQQSVTALRELAAELGATLQTDTAKLLGLEQNLAGLDSKIAALEEEIARTAGQERRVWDVRVMMSGKAPAELSYAYLLNDCGWAPIYRLEALPAQKKVDFSWQAKVWQRSGQDWSGIRLLLATMQPDSQSEPSDLPPWEVRPVQIYPRAKAAPVMLEMRAGAADSMVAAAPPAPVETRRGTYAAWDMGARSVPAGQTRVFEIERDSWKADFTHLMRPSLDPKAYLQARAVFDKARELPQGQAFFLIDGAMVDQRAFAFSGREATLSFGTDPMLTCESTLKDKKTGEKGLFKQKQTFLRQWTITLRNASDHPVQVRVEEPRPQPRDERISIEYSAAPEPLKEDDPAVLAWNSTIGAGAESVISLDLKMEAPEDLRIDPGWRW